ncbi:SDR family oxidoreductase [Rapidithrix thailandica]|uniref:SDR family oxidoreductase n=1 Tax=Rapidithrix thailandica TaxID=413964 RepID=A0AAW9S2Y3_9BACT
MSDNKVVFITGASSGIGRSIAMYLHQKGLKVYGTTRKTPQPGQEVFPLVQMDVNNEASVHTAIQKVIEKEGRLDVLINNAGLGIAGALEDTPIEKVEQVFDTNVYGILRTCQTVLPYMRQQHSGLIINISSIAAQMGLPFRGIYSASKAAVEALTETLSMEVKPFGIQICSIQPGDFNTNINQNRVVAESPENSPYKTQFEKIHQQIHKEVQHAGDPQQVAKQAYQIIQSRQPQLTYMVGKPLQKLSTQVKKLVSGRLFEKILLKHYGLNK